MVFEYGKPFSQDRKLQDNYHNLPMRVKTSLALHKKGVLFLVCPECRHKSKKAVTYEKHMKVKHGRFIDPMVYEIIQ